MGQAIRHVSAAYPDIKFVFLSKSEADISNKPQLEKIFKEIEPDFCINAAAYTAVDRAESEPEMAALINCVGAENVASVCYALDITLIQISTDFVFDGSKRAPYREDDIPNPLSVYGQTKLDGEIRIAKICPKHFIVRASWIYSRFGTNFMQTMLRLADTGKSIRVVNDQIGNPTNAIDVAEALIAIIRSGSTAFGTYHFSGEGETTWFDFAKAIFGAHHLNPDLQPISSAEFGAPAKRPSYSVLNKRKFRDEFHMPIPRWQESLLK